MKAEDWNVHGSVYVHIFRGFWQHGGMAVTPWNPSALNELWHDFLSMTEIDGAESGETDQLDDYASETSETERAPYFTSSLAITAVRAFYKCAGKARMLEVWSEIQDRWKDMDGDDRISVQNAVDKLCREDSVYVT